MPHPTKLSDSEKTLRRVLAVSAFDGWSMVVVAGLGLVFSVVSFSWLGIGISSAILAAGVIELFGRHRLTTAAPSGLNLLVSAQLVVLATITGYSFHRLLTFKESSLAALITPDMRQLFAQYGVSAHDMELMMAPMLRLVYVVVIALTVLFQGGLALYYLSCRRRLSSALAAKKNLRVPPPLPESLPAAHEKIRTSAPPEVSPRVYVDSPMHAFSYPVLSPYLTVRDAARAIDFYKAAFGATERFRLSDKATGKVGHSELLVEGCLIMLSEENADWGNKAPTSLGGSSTSLCIMVPDVDAAFRRAIAAGATARMTPADQFYGFRSASIVDPYGHQWMLQRQIEPLSPDEMQRRWDKLTCPESATPDAKPV